MSVICVIQARMGSTRLPGKVLADVGGQPLLQLMLSRIRGRVPEIVVATSTSPRDDSIEELCGRQGVPVVRGSEVDVLARFAQAADRFPADEIVRLTADCPLIDPEVITEAIHVHYEAGADYTSNTLLRTYPIGLDVEVMRTSALIAAHGEASDEVEREHVTPFLYRRPERFRLAALRTPEQAGDERWTVDTAEDLMFVREVVRSGVGTDTPWREILATVGRRQVPPPGAVRFRPWTRADSDVLLSWHNDPGAIAFSRSGLPVSHSDHLKWLETRIDCPRTRIWLGEAGGSPIGQVRIDVTAGTGEVALVVDPGHRGKEVERQLVAGLLRLLRGDYQVVTLRADVHVDNIASRSAFQSNGFAEDSTSGDFVTMVRPR